MAEHRSRAGRWVAVGVVGAAAAVSAMTIADWNSDEPIAPVDPATAAQTASVLQTAARPAAIASAPTDLKSFAEAPSTAFGTAVAPSAISGRWRDDEGFTYTVFQQGADYSFERYRGGARVGTGRGRITNREVRHSFVGADGQAECDGRIEENDSAIVGTCSEGGEIRPFRLSR